MINLSGENIVLVGALLLFVAVLAGKVAYRFGAPALLLFLGVGMLFGLDFISYRSVDITQFIGMMSLCVILFTGGMDTSFREIRPIIGPGVVLATAGVVMTALVLAGFVWLIAPWPAGAAAGRDDVLDRFGLGLFDPAKQEAGAEGAPAAAARAGERFERSDGLHAHDPAHRRAVEHVGARRAGHVGRGVRRADGRRSPLRLVGRLAVWTINRIGLANHSLYVVLLLAFVFFSFAFTDLVGGNGYLAVYLSGLVIGNHKLVQKRPLTVFFDGFTWLMQIVMFLTLGLFVNSDELLQPEVLILGCSVGFFLILVARPLSVFACLLPFRKFTARARLYISWVGLRGAVPILFAIYPMMDDVEYADLLFNVVFLSTIISLLVQGTTVSGMANLLGLAYEERESAFDVNMHEDMKSVLTEVEVNESMLESGHTLKDIVLPENTLVMMICRDGEYFVPQGKTELRLGDKLLVISDRGEELESTYREMGIDEVMKLG